MLVNGRHYKTIWLDKNGILRTIDQNLLPYKFKVISLKSSDEIINAIKKMTLRGAPIIGVAGAFGIYFAIKEGINKGYSKLKLNNYIYSKSDEILKSRPTAVNLQNAVKKSLEVYNSESKIKEKLNAVFHNANLILKSEERSSYKIGQYGLKILKEFYKKKNYKTINILTHCNAGWLACIDYGTALAPIYFAKEEGIKLHIWVEETRPRNQGSKLTAWELLQNNIPHTIITDNAGGYVMQKGLVDLVIVGSDRTTLYGDVCNKIGTYKTALAAKDNKIPFYVALPVSSFDLEIKDALKEINIEERDEDEVKYIMGYEKRFKKILIAPEESRAKNFGFDITPSRFVTALITDRGIIKPDIKSIKRALL